MASVSDYCLVGLFTKYSNENMRLVKKTVERTFIDRLIDFLLPFLGKLL